MGQDLATGACGLLNAGYFAHYWSAEKGAGGRRVGAAAMTLVSAAAVAESLFSEALYWSQQGVAASLGQVSPGLWALMRMPLFAATVVISALILRRVVS